MGWTCLFFEVSWTSVSYISEVDFHETNLLSKSAAEKCQPFKWKGQNVKKILVDFELIMFLK